MIYTIKQAPDDFAESTGLAKYGRSRMPGCFDSYQAGKTRDGKYITGLTNEEVEALSTPSMDLSPNSDFWKSFMVTIVSDSPRVFNGANPIDYISYKLLVANNYVAPDKESLDDYTYANAAYYAYVQADEDAKEISSTKKKDKARSLLLDIADNKEKMLLYGQYLEGIKYDSKLHEPTIYKMLRQYIDENVENVNLFLSLFDKSPQELQAKILIDKALKRKLIKKTQSGKGKHIYQYGQVTLGNTIEEVYRNLASVEFAPELSSIQKELR